MPKKQKGRRPAHQNTFAFKHNPKSKLTEKILASPNVGLCRRCHEKIEWRKKYRKYKPLTQLSKCNLCGKRNITAAYHTICGGCALSPKAFQIYAAGKSKAEVPNNYNPEKPLKVCAMCVKEVAMEDVDGDSEVDSQIQQQTEEMEKKLGRPLKLRESKGIERKVVRDIEREKQRLKDERRRLRDEKDAEKNAEKNKTETYDLGDLKLGGQDDEDPLEISRHDMSDTFVDDDSVDDEMADDPFLKAVGGEDKLLTGDAYQKMLLEREQVSLSSK